MSWVKVSGVVIRYIPVRPGAGSKSEVWNRSVSVHMVNVQVGALKVQVNIELAAMSKLAG